MDTYMYAWLYGLQHKLYQDLVQGMQLTEYCVK